MSENPKSISINRGDNFILSLIVFSLKITMTSTTVNVRIFAPIVRRINDTYE